MGKQRWTDGAWARCRVFAQDRSPAPPPPSGEDRGHGCPPSVRLSPVAGCAAEGHADLPPRDAEGLRSLALEEERELAHGHDGDREPGDEACGVEDVDLEVPERLQQPVPAEGNDGGPEDPDQPDVTNDSLLGVHGASFSGCERSNIP